MCTYTASAIWTPESISKDLEDKTQNQWETCTTLEQYLKSGQDNLKNLKKQCFKLEGAGYCSLWSSFLRLLDIKKIR